MLLMETNMPFGGVSEIIYIIVHATFEIKMAHNLFTECFGIMLLEIT